MNWKKRLAVQSALTVLTTGAIYAINKSINFIATRNNYLEQTPGNFYEWRFGKIFYTKKGTGDPILLIHDLNPGASGNEWHKIESTLAKKNTVYVIDLLGCGRSDKPNITYTNYLYVQLITDFIKHVIEKKTDVIATGESGTAVLFACHLDESIIGKIMAINPPDIKTVSSIPTNRTKMLKHLINAPIVGSLLYNILNTKKSVETLFKTNYFYDIDLTDDFYINVFFETLHSCGGRGKHLLSCKKGLYTNSSIYHCLNSINNSIFIVTGNGEHEYTKAAELYKSLLPSIEIVSVNKTKYLPHIEDPHTFIEHVNILFDL